LPWTLPTLEALFARFLDLPPDTPLREPTLYWLVNAFARTSAGGSQEESSLVLRDVFERVEARFGSPVLNISGGMGMGVEVGGLRVFVRGYFLAPESCCSLHISTWHIIDEKENARSIFV